MNWETWMKYRTTEAVIGISIILAAWFIILLYEELKNKKP